MLFQSRLTSLHSRIVILSLGREPTSSPWSSSHRDSTSYYNSHDSIRISCTYRRLISVASPLKTEPAQGLRVSLSTLRASCRSHVAGTFFVLDDCFREERLACWALFSPTSLSSAKMTKTFSWTSSVRWGTFKESNNRQFRSGFLAVLGEDFVKTTAQVIFLSYFV